MRFLYYYYSYFQIIAQMKIVFLSDDYLLCNQSQSFVIVVAISLTPILPPDFVLTLLSFLVFKLQLVEYWVFDRKLFEFFFN